jgi:TetR/AcrR family macrolide resistance operon transcriptional repressor
MPRKKTASDDDVLDAANAVLAEAGSTNFTLADVARKVALSRAALIQRFDNRETILRMMAEREVVATKAYLASIPIEQGLDGLWRFLREIIDSMGSGEGFSVRILIAFMESRETALRACAAERYRLVQEAIALRLPDVADRDELALHLHAVIAGATMQWVATQEGDLSAYVRRRAAEAIMIRFPDFVVA